MESRIAPYPGFFIMTIKTEKYIVLEDNQSEWKNVLSVTWQPLMEAESFHTYIEFSKNRKKSESIP